jgi:hypothetical protein
MIRKLFVGALAFAAISSVAQAQDVRTLGLGGALVPGPAFAPFNPAYSIYPSDGRGGGLTLPIGLLNFFINPQMNVIDFVTNPSSYADTTTKEFSFLASFDQLTHLNTFIIAYPAAPKSIRLEVGATGIRIFDTTNPNAEKEIKYDFNSQASYGAAVRSNSGVTPLFEIPFGIGPVNAAIGVFLSPSFGAKIDPALQADIVADGKLDQDYPKALVGTGQGVAGLTFSFGYADKFDVDGNTVYAGGRGSGFVGGALVEVTVEANVQRGQDSNNQPVNDVTKAQFGYKTTYFTASPFFPGGGLGFGGNADVGAAGDIPGKTLGVPELEKLTVGLGIIGLVDYSRWTGRETISERKPGASSDEPQIINEGVVRESANFNPLVTFNAAGTFSLEGGLRVLALFDTQFGRGQFSMHLGVEAQWALFILRTGIGIENTGFRFGLGGGIEVTRGFGLDFALTGHPTPLIGGTSLGIACALRFSF